jgi:Uma2 family endonuclease
MATQAAQVTQPAQEALIKRHLFTLEEYERVVESGGLDEDARIELIRGEILDMAPIGFPHEMCVARLTTLLVTTTVGRAIVWPQNNSIRLPSHSRPQPDVTLLRMREYQRDNPPTEKDVLLVIEVAESSLRYDRGVKGPLYAQAGILEYWIVNLRDNVVEVYADPVEGAFKQTRKARRGDKLPLPGGLEGAIEVRDILGGV